MPNAEGIKLKGYNVTRKPACKSAAAPIPEGRSHRMRVIVDEGIGESSIIWQLFQTWLGHRPAELIWLATLYPAIPDVEILDKLLTPETILLTQDRVLHNRALLQGYRSLTLNAHGQLTRKSLPLESRRVQAQAPSVLKTLKSSYQHDAHPIALKLNAGQSLKTLKTQRTRRRRIRSYFGSVDNIAKVAWTIGSRPHQGHLICGYDMRVEGYQGVKGLRASEGYGIDRQLPPHPAQCLVLALCEVFHLHLEAIKHEFFIIPPSTFDLAREVTTQTTELDSPWEQTMQQLFHTIPHRQVSPCVKGRFYDQMQRKLEQLATSATNEIVTLDFSDIRQRLAL